MYKRLITVALVGVVVALPATRNAPLHHHRNHGYRLKHRAIHRSRLVPSASARQLSARLSDFGDELRKDSVRTIEEARALFGMLQRYSSQLGAGSVTDPGDGDALNKRAKRRSRDRWCLVETKIVLTRVVVTTERVRPEPASLARWSSPPLPHFGSGPCHSLPRPREDAVISPSPSGEQAV